MITTNFNENITTELIMKNSIILDSKAFGSLILKGGYDYEDCCCGDTCSCGCGHNRIELNDKMSTVELDEMNSNILSKIPVLDPEALGSLILYADGNRPNSGGANQPNEPNQPNLPNPGAGGGNIPGGGNNPDNNNRETFAGIDATTVDKAADDLAKMAKEWLSKQPESYWSRLPYNEMRPPFPRSVTFEDEEDRQAYILGLVAHQRLLWRSDNLPHDHSRGHAETWKDRYAWTGVEDSCPPCKAAMDWKNSINFKGVWVDKTKYPQFKEYKGGSDGNNNNNNGNNTTTNRDNNSIINDIYMDNTMAQDLNDLIVDNIMFGQPDINIPLIALRMAIMFLICMFIEVCNAWEALWVNKKSNNASHAHWKNDNTKFGSKFLDAPVSWGLYFQDAASPSFEGIVDLHNRIMFYLVVILFGVSWVLMSVITNFNNLNNKLVYRHLNHGTLIELIWTVGPALVLVAIAFPSFKLLYLMDEVIDPAMTVKVTGHQWFWEYEYADFLNEENEAINFDSYMKDESILEKGQLRMLEVDNPLLLPIDTHIRFVITAADVLHDWALPSLSLKVDACPGRLNQASVIIERPGVLYGQCSEICGVLHSSMPINIEAVEVEKFFLWLLEQ